MESERLTIEREELYCQVWAEPIFRLAPKYGISNVALKKIFWAREYADRIDPLIGDAWNGSSSLKKN
jgi:hypothetical protein